MKLLITGGAGFIGSNFIHYILEKYKDYEVINLDKLTYAGNLDNLKDIENDSRYTFLKGDISDKITVYKIFQENKIDAVINYAAQTHVDRSILEPDEFIKTDIFGTYNLLEAVRKFGVKKMIQISTDEVYGEIKEGEFFEGSPFRPNSPYSASKAGADHLCRAYWVTYKTPVIVTHSCNVYGQYQYPEKLIPLFITNLIEDKRVPVYGDGQQIREWIYITDHCEAIDLILHKGKVGEVYNIGTSNRIANIEVTRLLLLLLRKDESYIEYVEDRQGHDFRYALNWEKIKNNLGWKPKVSFEQGLKSTVEWYKANRWWWEKIKSGEYLEYYKKQYNRRLHYPKSE